MSELKSYIVDYYGKLKKLLFVVAFFGFIMLPVVQMLSNFLILEEVESFDEKREMVKWDDVQASSLDTLISSYGSYFKDNFGLPDMTYGWSKLTGEYLAKIAHEKKT